MYKPSQQFLPARPGSATRRIVEGQIIDAAKSFCIPAAVDGHPSPWRLLGDRVTHNLALFISFKMIAGARPATDTGQKKDDTGLGGNDDPASNRHLFELPHLDRPPAFCI
jgi:hypothetical protein